MRLHGLCTALALALTGACFVDAGPSEGGSGGGTTGGGGKTTGGMTGASTGSGTTAATTGATTGVETTGATTTGSVSSGMTSDPGGGTTAAATGASTSDGTTGAPQSPCDAYYWTDFSVDPAADWDVVSSTWSWNKDAGLYRGASMNTFVAISQVNGGSWSDVRVRARLRLVDTSVGGVLLRVGDALAGEYMYLRLNGMTGAIEGLIGNMPQFSIGGVVVPGTWHELDVALIGKTLSFSVDGAPLANGPQIEGLGAGTVGVIAQTGAVEVDELYVCPPK